MKFQAGTEEDEIYAGLRISPLAGIIGNKLALRRAQRALERTPIECAVVLLVKKTCGRVLFRDCALRIIIER